MLWTTTSCGSPNQYDHASALSFNDLPYPAETRTYVHATDQGDVHVAYVDVPARSAESGAPLLLVHGLGENLAFWEHNLTALSAERRVVAVDLPGFGRSDKPERTYSMAFFADVVTGLSDHLGLPRAVLVGHSMGGHVSLLCAIGDAAREPDDRRFGGLILAAPAGIETFDRGEADFLRNAVSTDLYMSQTEDAVRANYRNQLFYRWRPEYETLVEHRVRLAKDDEFKAYAYAVVQSIHGMLDGPVRNRLDRIDTPTLVVFGRQDALIPNPFLHGGEPESVGIDAIEAIQGAELEMIDEAGHMLQYERPERFNEVVLGWLTRKGL